MIEYEVRYACWAPDQHAVDEHRYARPSAAIDDRTIRVKIYGTKKDAMAYAKQYRKHHKDDKWLAYLEVIKVERRLIGKLV